ncbi:class I SAM-dependent methyltransferase [Actinoplanes sp. CA-252034]|uniref:class I SAM-dependent methyltransferase n=1 Tax=Actinoplanes sp. CA-252034 TaxID=3239906 RepID=UPI003D985692
MAELTAEGFTDVTGADISAGLIERGRRDHPGLRFTVLDSPPVLDRPAGSVDVILLFAVLTCVPDDAAQRALIAELDRLLAPGGLIHVSDLLLQDDDRNRRRYTGSPYGVFTTGDGATCRHHTAEHLRALLTRSDVGDDRRIDVGDERRIDVGDERRIDAGDERRIDVGDERRIDAGDERRIDAGDERRIDVGDERRIGVGDECRIGVGDERRIDGADERRIGVGDERRIGSGDDRRFGGEGQGRTGGGDRGRIDVVAERRIDVATMNGNRSAALQLLARKRR